MFENMTYAAIIQRMKDRIEEQYPDVDMREGSLIFNAIAPAAMELSILYSQLDNVLKESFITTASRHYLLLACQQMGIDISQFRATRGIHRARFNVPVTIGSRWNCDIYNYEVLQEIDDQSEEEQGLYIYLVRCETAGSAPNGVIGTLTPIDFNNSMLSYADLSGVVVNGEDEATDDEIREIYQLYITDTLVDGNVAQYEYWCQSYDGIGRYRIFPLWNGANTVKVLILNSNGDIADDGLVAEFQEYLDPGITGMGDGVAPIGAFVTVGTATPKEINVSANVKLKDGYEGTDLLGDNLIALFNDTAFNRSVLPYMEVGATLINSDGVDYVSDLLINGGTDNIVLAEDEAPVLGTATWTVIADE